MGAVHGSLCVDRHIATKWSNVLLTADDCLTTPNPTEERSPRPQVVVWSTCTRRNLAPSQNAVTPRRPCSVSNQLPTRTLIYVQAQEARYQNLRWCPLLCRRQKPNCPRFLGRGTKDRCQSTEGSGQEINFLLS